MSQTDKLIINAAVTGTVLYKSDTPCLPTSLAEIVEDARRVREAGASIIHLHARAPDESPSYDPAVYTELVDRVRDATDLIVNVSLSGRFVQDVERMFTTDFARSSRAAATDYTARPWWFRLAARTSRLMAPVQ